MNRKMHLKQVVPALALLVLLAMSGKAQDNGNPPEDCTPTGTNIVCAPEPGPQFLSVTVTNQCVAGAMIVATATYTNVPGMVTTTITYDDPDLCPDEVTNHPVSSTILTNWWTATGGAVPSSGPGLGTFFDVTNCGGGTVYFYITYSNPPPCSNATTISTSIGWNCDCDCHHHNEGDGFTWEDIWCPLTGEGWDRQAIDTCGEQYGPYCNGAVHLTRPGGECGRCIYEWSHWVAYVWRCECHAMIVRSRFNVSSNNTTNSTFGQGIVSSWSCSSGTCSNWCYTVLSWQTNSLGVLVPLTVSERSCN